MGPGCGRLGIPLDLGITFYYRFIDFSAPDAIQIPSTFRASFGHLGVSFLTCMPCRRRDYEEDRRFMRFIMVSPFLEHPNIALDNFYPLNALIGFHWILLHPPSRTRLSIFGNGIFFTSPKYDCIALYVLLRWMDGDMFPGSGNTAGESA